MGYVSKKINKSLNNARKKFDEGNMYDKQVNSLVSQINNRPAFSYDATLDPQYQLIQQQYQAAGQQAMQDTMAQAAALSGGYGNSYAQTAGQQAYDSYIKQAANNIPELYKAAYSMYQDEGNNMMNKLSMYQSLADSRYARKQDRLNYWQSVADNARNFNYQKSTDTRNFKYQKKTDTRNFKYQKKQDEFNNDLAYKYYLLQKAATEASLNKKTSKKGSGKRKRTGKPKNTKPKKTSLFDNPKNNGGGLLK